MKKGYYIYFDKSKGKCPPCDVVKPYVDRLINDGYEIEELTREEYAERYNTKLPVTPRIKVEGDDELHQVYFREDDVDYYHEFNVEDIYERIKVLLDNSQDK